MKRAFITGITGQDGYYLAEFLKSKGYEVHGLVRRNSKHLYDVPSGCVLHYGDLSDAGSLRKAIFSIKPDEIYNLAAQSHVRVSFENPEYTIDVNGTGVIRVLDAVKDMCPKCRIYQASSSEMFGRTSAPQNEDTPFKPQSPYACAKVYAYHQCVNYRDAYGIFVCNGIMFNHESPRRGPNFVTRKIAKAAANIYTGNQHKLLLGRLDTFRDWGWAPEYVQAMWQMLQVDEPDDFVVATGETHTVEDFVREAFKVVDLDWKKYVEHDVAEDRPADVPILKGDASKIKEKMGWSASVRFSGIVKKMVEAELEEPGG